MLKVVRFSGLAAVPENLLERVRISLGFDEGFAPMAVRSRLDLICFPGDVPEPAPRTIPSPADRTAVGYLKLSQIRSGDDIRLPDVARPGHIRPPVARAV